MATYLQNWMRCGQTHIASDSVVFIPTASTLQRAKNAQTDMPSFQKSAIRISWHTSVHVTRMQRRVTGCSPARSVTPISVLRLCITSSYSSWTLQGSVTKVLPFTAFVMSLGSICMSLGQTLCPSRNQWVTNSCHQRQYLFRFYKPLLLALLCCCFTSLSGFFIRISPPYLFDIAYRHHL